MFSSKLQTKNLRTILISCAVISTLLVLRISYDKHLSQKVMTKFVPIKLKDNNQIGEKKDWNDYKFLVNEASRVGPGEMGKRVVLSSLGEVIKGKKQIHEEGFNVVISDMISPDRSLPEVRHENCVLKKYLRNLPKTSVIIASHDEHWSLLLRCIHSIYNRTPPELLQEIILINDKSSIWNRTAEDNLRKHLGGKLKLITNTVQKGLIVTRMEGAQMALGEVIVFLDSHMEVTNNWLPPLLEPIILNPKTATVPALDSFSPYTLEYEKLGHGTRGGFNWELVYKWFPMRDIDKATPDEPFPLPVMTGGAYAIRRKYFLHLGGYDRGLRIWNGENFEISFKLWLCGGQLLDVPCSHVAHTSKLRAKYREHNYGFDFIARNLKRVAEVWMDEYKVNLYKTDPKRYSLDAGDLSHAFDVKHRLDCKPFKYFLENIAPEVLERYPITERGNFATGAIVSQSNPTLCVSYMQKSHLDPLELTLCSPDKAHPYSNQDFLFTWNRHIKLKASDMECIDGEAMNLKSCHFLFEYYQFWKYDLQTHQIMNPERKICMSANISTKKISAVPCKADDLSQKFGWGYLNVTACSNWETFGVKLPKTSKIL